MELGDFRFVFLALEPWLGSRLAGLEILSIAELRLLLLAHNSIIDALCYHLDLNRLTQVPGEKNASHPCSRESTQQTVFRVVRH